MNRKSQKLLLWIAAASAWVLALSLVPWGQAQDSPQQGPPFTGTPAEMEAYDLYTKNKLLTARTKAEEVLKQDPNSMPGHYVLGCVYREAEGSLARAMFHLGKARELYEMRYGSMAAGGPWQLHRETLYSIQALAGEMEEHEYQLQILDYYDSIYDPDLVAEHAWPLLHLGRYDEARQWASRAQQSSDEFQKSLGLNALCAIEAEARTRDAQYRACMAALENARRRRAAADPNDPNSGASVAVHAYNASLGAWAAVKHDEVERLATEATTRLEFTIANPWRILLRLHLDGANMTKAIEAAREMNRWRGRQPANLRDQDRAETDVAIATLLLVAGEAETGLDAVDRAIERPDRRGLTSTKPEQSLGAHALLRRALQRTMAEQTAEEASYSGTSRRVTRTFAAMGQRLAAWPDDERIASVLADDDRIEATVRLFVHGGIEPVPVWLVGDLVDVLGAGVVSVALRNVREYERDPALAPYYAALEAEIALEQRDYDRSIALARQAMDRLPAREVMLHARTAAVAAQAADRNGDPATALAMYERAMQKDPGIIRRLGLAIPTVITARDGGIGGDVAERLERSPRFDVEDRGFRLATSTVGRGVRVTFSNPQGARIFERVFEPLPAVPAQPAAEGRPAVEAQPPEPPEDFTARVCEEVHAELFALRAGLTTIDLRSLDGSTVAGEQATREQMQNVLNDIVQQGEQTP